MQKVSEIKIPKKLCVEIAAHRELVNVYSTHSIFKAFETFCILKQLTTSGLIQNTCVSQHTFYIILSKSCLVSINTIKDRIYLMKKLDLIEVQENGSIRLSSWESIAKSFNIKLEGFFTLKCGDDVQKLEHQFRALAIKEHKQRMAWRFANWIKNNNQYRTWIISQLPEGLSIDDIEALAKWITENKIKSFKIWSESFDQWHTIPNEINPGVSKIQKIFSYIDPRQVAYWKRKFAALKLAVINVRKYASGLCTRNATSVLTGAKMPQNVFWDPDTKQRIFQLTDEINFAPFAL